MKMQKFINDLVLKAGQLVLKGYGKVHDIQYKQLKELVTETDKNVENFIKQEIIKKFPGHQIMGEESEVVNRDNTAHIWYIDPIDGTANFIQGLPVFGISIGYEFEGSMKNGAVYMPVLDELFYAEKNKGSFLNKKKIFTSKIDELAQVTASTGFSCVRTGRKDNNLKYFVKIVPQIRGIRRMGSAAFDLCCVACGRVDVFWEMELKPWDIMAGKLITEEAGGKVTDFSGTGKLNEKREILAANGPALHEQFLCLLKV